MQHKTQLTLSFLLSQVRNVGFFCSSSFFYAFGFGSICNSRLICVIIYCLNYCWKMQDLCYKPVARNIVSHSCLIYNYKKFAVWYIAFFCFLSGRGGGGNLSSVSVAAAAAIFSVISNAATLICLFPLWLLPGSRQIGCYRQPTLFIAF